MELGSDILLKLQQYLNDEMDGASRISFEVEISNSEKLQEFIALFNNIDNLEDEDTWNSFDGDTEELKRVVQLFREQDTLEFSEKVKKIRASSSETKAKSRKPYRLIAFTLMAACLAAIIFFVFPKETNMAQMYSENSSWNELPSFAVKGDSMDEKRREVEQAFEDGSFELVISLSENIMTNIDKVDASMYLYNGVAHLELDQFNEAVETFNDLAKSNSIDSHKGFWYIALVYLKQENKEKTVESLERVVRFEGNYKYKQASKLLKELE